MQNSSPMFEFSSVYKPFNYSWAMEAAKQHEKIHWVEDEVTLEEDINDWKRNKLSSCEKQFITQVLRLFTQSDVSVGGYYYDKLIPLFKNNEIRNMLGSFSAREGIHQRAYALLNDSLGLPEGDYAAFLEYAEMKDKMEYMMEAPTNPTLDDIGSMLAKSVFNEGVSLFASFAMLLNFQRRGLMRGAGKIVEWSIRDETCFTGETEILTEKGWKRFTNLDESTKVAQYDQEYGKITWVKPLRYISKHFEGSLINFKHDKLAIDITSTEDHDLLIQDHNSRYNMCRKVKADEFIPDFNHKFICAGKLTGEQQALTAKEKLLIAGNANPVQEFKLNPDEDFKYWKFFIEGVEKIIYFKSLVSELGYTYQEDVKKSLHRNSADLTIKVPKDADLTLDWINTSAISSSWCEQALTEFYFWKNEGNPNDGCKLKMSVDSNTANTLQILCALGGFKCHYVSQPFSKQLKTLTISKECVISTANAAKVVIPYAGMVYCVTVPNGNIIIKQRNRVIIVGNCHVDGISKLYKAFIGEHKKVVNDEFKSKIYVMAEHTVANEDKFIDLAYSGCNIEGLTLEDTKQYIRYLADRRLIQLGLKGIFKVKTNPLPWIEALLNAPTHDNFFEARTVSYEIAGLKGKWRYE